MKPAPFDYADPRSVDEAVDLLARHGDDAKVLAGGQSLVPMLALRLARPSVVVDINRVAGLDAIDDANGVVRVGALVRQRALARWAAERLPVLAAALALIGHGPIRTRGTAAGSVAHADPAAELPALLLCLGGSVVARRRAGERVLAADEFFQGPLLTALAADELVTETRWPRPADGAGWGLHEVARRHGDFALAGAVAVVTLRAGRVATARLALFGVGPTPLRAAEAEAALVGLEATAAAVDGAAAAAAARIEPEDDLHASAAYRRTVTRTLAARALTDAVARAGRRS